jgi:hypothetical protein
MKRQELNYLVLLFLAAFLIRVVAIDWGLPSQNYPYAAFQADEPIILHSSLAIGRGEYNLFLRNYPFFYYLSFLVFSFYYLIGLLTGAFTNLADFKAQYVQDISQFLLVGRYFIVVMASLIVVMTYFLGRRMFGRQVGVIASIFMLFSFGHVLYSQVFRLDSFLPFLFLLSLYWMMGLENNAESRLRPFVIGAILLACTVATKLTAWALIVPFFLIPFIVDGRFSWRIQRWPHQFVFSLVVLLGAYIAMIAPTLVEIQSVLAENSVTISQSDSTAHLAPYQHSLFWHALHILPRQLSLPVYFLALAGLLFMIFDRQNRLAVYFLLATLVAYLIPVGYSARTTWRDMLPMLPLLSISAAYALNLMIDAVLVKRLNRPELKIWATAVAVTLLLIIPVANIVQYKYLMRQQDTRDIAREWIHDNIPPQSKIAVESYGPGIVDEGHRQRVSAHIAQLGQVEQRDRLRAPTYRVYLLDWDLRVAQDELEPDKLVPYLLRHEIQYVVVSSGFYGRFYNEAVDLHYPDRGRKGREFHDVIASNLQLVQQIIPDPRYRPGPVIKIYKVPVGISEPVISRENSFDPFPEMLHAASVVGYYEFSPR